jgi:hypothetical protein
MFISPPVKDDVNLKIIVVDDLMCEGRSHSGLRRVATTNEALQYVHSCCNYVACFLTEK